MVYLGEEPDGSSSIDITICVAGSPVVQLRHKQQTEGKFDDLLILVQAGTAPRCPSPVPPAPVAEAPALPVAAVVLFDAPPAPVAAATDAVPVDVPVPAVTFADPEP